MARDELNATSFVILGILVSRDHSAYEIANFLGAGMGELYPLAERQRYNAPKKLVELGHATARTEATGKRTRTVYSITPTGIEALRGWLAQQPSPAAMEFEGMIRVLVAEQGTIDDLRSNLAAIGEQARAKREIFVRHAQTIRSEHASFPEREHLFALASRFMVDHFTLVADWSDWALAETESWSDTTTPATTHHERSAEVLDETIRRGTT